MFTYIYPSLPNKNCSQGKKELPSESSELGQSLAQTRYSASEIKMRLSHFSWSQIHKSQKRTGPALSGAHP